MSVKPMIALAGDGNLFTVGLKNNGTCIATGYNYSGQLNVSKWTDVKQIACGSAFTVGLKNNGTCIATGDNSRGQLNVSKLTDVKQIACGNLFTVGLKNNGTCIATGDNSYGQLNVSNWTEIVQICAGTNYAVGLKNDGTCIVAGYNIDLSNWTGLKQVAANGNLILGVRNDGTCVFKDATNKVTYDVSSWTNIKQVSCGRATLSAVKNDGTCVLLTKGSLSINAIDSWTDIVQIGAGNNYVIGLKNNGTCIATGDNSYGQCNVSNWLLKLFKQGLVTSKTGLNCTNVTAVEGFNLSGVQPTNTNRRVIFKIDNTWSKLTTANNTTTLTAVATQPPTSDSILAEGNTVDELVAVTAIPAFVGKIVYPAIAMFADTDVEVMPSLSIELKTRNNQDKFQHEELSAEYQLADTDVSVVSITSDVTCAGQATVAVMVSLKQNGTWSGWMTPISTKGQKASAIKFKSTYTVTTLDGTDTAKLNRISCIYCNSNSYVSGNTAEILTITADYEKPLSYVRGHVIHKKLMDAEIKAYISFREKPKTREMLNIGTGTGERQTIQLADSGINHNTLQVYFDGKPTYNFDYNTELSQILCIAPEGTAITASYQYGWEKEEWLPMQNIGTQPKQASNNYMTSFAYELPADKDNKSISVVKVELYRPNGTISNEKIGVGTGKRQLFVLPHYAKKETLKCSASFSYDDNSRILTVVATKDAEIKVSYDWIAETHELSGLVAAWNE